MKYVLLTMTILCSSVFCSAQEDTVKGYVFSTIKEVPVTSVKNQAASGTCWCFSGLGMVEADLLRMGKGTCDLSEMFIVYNNYFDKALKYVRMHGTVNFSPGGSFADVFDGIREYGLVPESVMNGLNYGEENHRHGELDALSEAYVKALIKNPNRKLSSVWQEGYKGILNAYLGKAPEKFTYEGKEYTPHSFAKSLGIDADNYISFTSFTHHPFYEPFVVEVPDNWRWALSYNVPMEEMMSIMDQALEKGYTVAWAADVSETGFTRKGIAVVPDFKAKEVGTDEAHWLGLSEKERQDYMTDPKEPAPELNITQAMRQEGFDNYQTTDDHGMLIYGTAKDQKGNRYYMVKNSWGTDNTYKGTWYASEAFVKYKTISFVVHKDILSNDLKKKLKLN
jgi:Aminopeptidase C